MTIATDESSRQFYARLAGFTFLFYIAAGLTSVFLYRQATDAEGTRAIMLRIAQHASSFRFTILMELLECFSAIVLAVALFGITRDVSYELALLGLAFRVAEGVLGAKGIPNSIALIWLSKGGMPDAATAGTLGEFFLNPSQFVMIGAPFFAAGSTIFSWLMLRGRVVPVPLAWIGVFASVLLLVGVPLQLAGFIQGAVTMYMWLPMIAFEVPAGLWLLIKGAAPIKN